MNRLRVLVLAALALPLPSLAQSFPLTPDSERQAGVPQGRTESSKLISKKWFPGTVRDLKIYVPAQYDPQKPACVLVMQDGGGYRIETVLDNLIARGEVPITIGIFLTPGVVPAKDEKSLPRFNRSFEYDSPNDTYTKFLLDEVLPEVSKKYNLSSNPNDRAIAGASSGGIAAFTAAFFRPDAFRRVISFIGSYTDLRGATNYGALVRKFEPKPIRVFLQEGRNDQDIYSGSWPIGNTDLEAGLKFARYDFQMVWGEGRHDGSHGTAVMPEALRFIWKGWPAPIETPRETPQPVTQLTMPGEGWMSYDTLGTVNTIIDAHNNIQSISESSVSGPVRATDGRTPGSVDTKPFKKRMKALLSGGFLARGVIVANNGNAYATRDDGGIYLISTSTKGKRERRVVGNVPDATGITLTPDQTQLLVSSGTERYVYSFLIQPDGSLVHQQPYHEVYVAHGETKSRAGGMVTDTNGWLYVASPFGIQVLDQAGRVNGILVNPTTEPTAQLTWLGNTLIARTADGRTYARKMRAVGTQPLAAPVKPPAPRL